MGTRDEAIEVLSEHLNESVESAEAHAAFCAKYEIRPFRDGWIFQTHSRKKEMAPLWYMVVGSGVHGYLFFQMANPRAYALASQRSGVLAK